MAQHDGQQNAALPVAFNRFIQVMNQDAAKDLVRMINTFMKDFKHRPSNPEVDSQAVQAFLQQMETAMAKHSMFADSTPAEQDAATEALEKYLMTKLFDRTFRQTADDIERDDILALRCAALQFVVPAHLEIPDGVVDDQALAAAVVELNKINQYKAPCDKLVCILNCCRMLTNMLTSRSKAEGIGADDFTPLLIYVVIRAQTPQLASNLAYIERYRYHSKLTSETQYYYIQLCGAATFIEMVNATSLKVDRDEFIAHMLAAGAMSDEQLLQLQSSNSIDGQPSPLHPAKDSISKSTAQAAAQAAAAGVPVQQQQQQPMVQVAVPAPAPEQWYEQQPQQQQQLRMQAMPATAAVAQDYYGQQWPPPPPPPQQQYYQQQPVAYGQPQQQQHQQQYQQQYPRPQQQQQISYQQYLVQPQQQQQPRPGFAPLPSVAQLEVQGSQISAGRGASAVINSHIASKYPFSCSTLEGLSLGDVSKLLVCYKELVLRHEALVAALEHSQQQQQQQSQQEWLQAAGSIRQPAAATNAGVAPAAAAAVPTPPPPPTTTNVPPPPPAPAAAAGGAAAPPPPPTSTAWPAAAAAEPIPHPAPNVMAPTSSAAAPGPAAAAVPPPVLAAAAAALQPDPSNLSLGLAPAAETAKQVADGVVDAVGTSEMSGPVIGSQTENPGGQTDTPAAAAVAASAQLHEGTTPAYSRANSHQNGDEHKLERVDNITKGQQQQQEQEQQQQGLDLDGQVDVAAAAADESAGAGAAQQQQRQQHGGAVPQDSEQQQSEVDELLHTLLDGEAADAPVTAEPLPQQQQQQQHIDGSQHQQQDATSSIKQSTSSGADLFGGLSVSDDNQAPEGESAAAAAATGSAAGTTDATDDDDLFGLFQRSGPAKPAVTPAAAPRHSSASADSLLD